MRALLSRYGTDVAGLTAHAAIVAGVWGLGGWPVAAIVAGAPFALFYYWGEYRASRGNS